MRASTILSIKLISSFNPARISYHVVSIIQKHYDMNCNAPSYSNIISLKLLIVKYKSGNNILDNIVYKLYLNSICV